jgi:sortase A
VRGELLKRTRVRRLGTVLLILGAFLLAYGATIYLWRDPATDLYNRWKQHQLASELDKTFAEYKETEPAPTATVETGATDAPPATGTDGGEQAPGQQEDLAALLSETRRAASRFFARLEPGQALGRLEIPKLHVDPVFVNGTKWGRDLSRGPGRYPETSIPGLGKVTAIAGHRTTFGAPFRHIDRLAAGDEITLELPYGIFRYRVVSHEIVENDDWSIIRDRGYDALVLSACHPLYSASHRWIVYARLAEVQLPDGVSYTVPRDQLARGAGEPVTG